MRAAQQALGHGHRLALEITDRLKIAVAQPLGRLAHQGVQRQGGGDGGDAAAGQGRAGRKDVQRHPADDPVAAGAAPGPIVQAMKHVEGLAVQQLVDALTRVGQDVRDRDPAMHGLGPHIGLGGHQPFQRLFRQHHPISVPKDQRRAGRKKGQKVGQTRTRRRFTRVNHGL
ncbi:hypothetical protein D3C80_1271320 [compost metagenome]